MITVDEILQIVSLQLGIRDINSDQRLVEDLAAESADLVNIIAKVEEKYSLIFPEEDIATVKTVNDIYQIATRISNP